MTMIRKQFPATIKGIDPAQHRVTALVSVFVVDRDQEAIAPQAFAKSLPVFMRNAVHLWAHDSSKLENILGRAISVDVVAEGLLATFEYAVDANPAAKMAFDLIQAGGLSAYSVGFMPVAWATPDDKAFTEMKGKARRVYTEVELWEISLCAIPSNPEALVVGRDATTANESEDRTVNTPTHAKIGHTPTNDIVHRLMGAIESLSSGYWDEPSEDPPEPEVCAGVVRVLEQVIADLKILAGADDNDEALAPPVTAAASKPAVKTGSVLSSDNQEIVTKMHGCMTDAVKHCQTLMKAAGMSFGDGTQPDGEPDGGESGGKPSDEGGDEEKSLTITLVG